jgi:predicted peptidase
MRQAEFMFNKVIEKKVYLKYLLYLPKDYNAKPDYKWPMILFLHGMGERGDNLEIVKISGIPKIVEEKEDFPFIAVSPQCPANSNWILEQTALHALVMEIIEKYNVDKNRLYLTGLSMGGFGAWHLAEAYPHLFAAVVPICGGDPYWFIARDKDMWGSPERFKILKDIPIWVFHGAKDETVPIENSRQLVDILQKYNGNVKFTVYPDVGHNSWERTYENPELYDWLLNQHNKSKSKNMRVC